MDSTKKDTKPRKALKKSRKYVTYNALMLAMRKAAIPMFGAHATFLLDAFLEDDGRVLASTVYARGLCEEKQFREWRKNLIDKGWLVWSESQLDKGIYFPGKKLIPYINKEKIAQKEIATRESVEKMRSDLSAKIDSKADRSDLAGTKAALVQTNAALVQTKAELNETKSKLAQTDVELKSTRDDLTKTKQIVNKIAVSVQKLQMAKEPPITDEKLATQRQAEREIADHTRELMN